MPAFAGAFVAVAGVSGRACTGSIHSGGPPRQEQTVRVGAVESVRLLYFGGVTH
jgi:outer membrane lipoprotein SlyB